MSTKLSVMCWNIAEGTADRTQPLYPTLKGIANEIKSISPDIVLLNEIKNQRGFPFGNGINQIRKLQELTNIPFGGWGNTVATGWTGHKAVGILSKFEILTQKYIPITLNNTVTGYGIYEATIKVNGIPHYLYSTRFNAHNDSENIAAHQQATSIIKGLPPNTIIIFGGDFNTKPNSQRFIDFVKNSGLINTDNTELIDHILYRGIYDNYKNEIKFPGAHLSDHFWIFTDFFLNKTEPTECESIRQSIDRKLIELRNTPSRLLKNLSGGGSVIKPIDMGPNPKINELKAEIRSLENRKASLGCYY